MPLEANPDSFRGALAGEGRPSQTSPKNIVAEALKVRAFLSEDPLRTYIHASQRFKVTKARISLLMKITDVLPREFVVYMGRCEDQYLIKLFSGKTLLRIAGLESLRKRHQVISRFMERGKV